MIGLVLCRREHYRKLKAIIHGLGYCAAPDDSYLVLRGLRTLAVHMARHAQTGLRLANWLAARPEVARVLYPALPGDPGHVIWLHALRSATAWPREDTLLRLSAGLEDPDDLIADLESGFERLRANA